LALPADIVTAPGGEREAVLKHIKEELATEAAMTTPEIVAASAASVAIAAPTVKSDPTKTVNPNLEGCRKLETDEKENKLLITNNCGENILIQYENQFATLQHL